MTLLFFLIEFMSLIYFDIEIKNNPL